MEKEQFVKSLITENERMKQVQLIAEYVLNQEKATKAEKALSGRQIFTKYEQLVNEYSNLPIIPKNTFNLYISKISNSSDSKINCEGRKQGYYLDQIFEKIEETNKKLEIEKIELEKEDLLSSKEKGYLLERDLYPYLEQWLFELDNERVADISTNRSQGKWANPDLVGIKIDNLFGTTELELTTIEAKLTIENWEQWIFESIAHTIFSNRSYYAFVHSEEHINKIDKDLKHYAETFKVGILIMAISAKDYLKVQNKQAFQLTEENHQIIEYSPAPYNIPHTKFRKRFLQALGIYEPKDLYRFGKAIEK